MVARHDGDFVAGAHVDTVAGVIEDVRFLRNDLPDMPEKYRLVGVLGVVGIFKSNQRSQRDRCRVLGHVQTELEDGRMGIGDLNHRPAEAVGDLVQVIPSRAVEDVDE